MSKSRKLVSGVGINDVDYEVQKPQVFLGRLYKKCPFYDKWQAMLWRCYSKKSLYKHPSYKDCLVCSEWLKLSNFKSWMETQDWEGRHLDKDLLVPGNKLYSPDTCCFISIRLNSFITEPNVGNNGLPAGVTFDKLRGILCSN